MDCRECGEVNSALSDAADVSAANDLWGKLPMLLVCQGVTPGHEGFVLTPDDKTTLPTNDPSSAEVIFPYLIGRELLTGDGQPMRSVIDFGQMTILDAQRYAAAFQHVKSTVLPGIQNKADKEHESESAHRDQLERWWMHWRPCREFIDAIEKLPRFLVCSRVTKRPIFVFVHHSIRPGDALQAFSFQDDYSFGILQSHTHWLWFVTKCSKLKSDFRYTPPSVFDTFPWPQAATVEQIDAVAAAARDVRRVRAEALPKLKGGLRALYRTLELPGANPLKDAHAALDAAVLAAYSFSPKRDLLAQLLALNQEVAGKIERGEPVTAPGVPPDYPEPKKLVTEDCIKPA